MAAGLQRHSSMNATRRKKRLVMVGNGMAGVRTLEELLKLAPDALRHHRVRRRAASELQPHPAVARARRRADARRDRAERSRLVRGERHHAASRQGGRADRPRAAQGDRRRRHRRAHTTACCSPPARPRSSCRSRARICPGVITYRDIADTDAMIDAAKRYRHAVVIGGGLLGLEAANGLKLRGMDVTVVHLMPWLMERQLDRAAADLLQSLARGEGPRVPAGSEDRAAGRRANRAASPR